jgi:hypothetical protein
MKTANPAPAMIRMAAAAMSAMLFLQLGGSAMAQDYRDMSCEELWYERNAIYADKGYCFETARARRAFGPGCFPPYGELNRSEQEEVEEIKYLEQRKGC